MSKTKKKSKLFVLVPLAAIAAIGVALLAVCINRSFLIVTEMGLEAWQQLLFFIYMVAALLIVHKLHTVLHELGHMVFGLATGYKFLSFRVGKILFAKGEKKPLKNYIKGTGGQCLMIPPDTEDWSFPTGLYNAGGFIMNALLAALGIALYCLTPHRWFTAPFFLFSFAIGVYFVAINGIPLRVPTICNDGKNILELKKSEAVRRAFWIQLKITEQSQNGVRLKDMPDEWFSFPEAQDMEHDIVGCVAVFCQARKLDCHDFDAAETLADRIKLHVGLQRQLLNCDRIFYRIMRGDFESAHKLMTPGQQNFMWKMRGTPAVLRSIYAYTILDTKDLPRAKAYLDYFAKIEKTYPYKAEIQSERELMDMVTELAREKGLKIEQAEV